MNLEASLKELNPALKEWGAFVILRIQEYVELEIGAERKKSFFKIEPNFRVKDADSAVAKQSNKKYSDPLEAMTDLVGARFVVLLKTDIDIVERAVITCTAWAKSKDRNPQDERDQRPNQFEYQSVHFVVRNNKEFTLNNITIPEGMACEIQIRTLLQHAYAELVHDKFYKATEVVPQSALRLVARSMALMETTDEMFIAAVAELERVNQGINEWCSLLDGVVGPILTNYVSTIEDEDAIQLLGTFKHLLDMANTEEVKATLSLPLVTRIKAHALEGRLFNKPVVLVIYWLATHYEIELTAAWPIPRLRSDLDLVKSHIGFA